MDNASATWGQSVVIPGEASAPDGHQQWLLTPRDVSRLLNVSLSKVYQLLGARSGGIKSIAIGRSRRVRTSDLRAWLDDQPVA